jgi:di/tricarboxylate transporter
MGHLRTAGIICIVIGLAVLMGVLASPATSDFEWVRNVAVAMAAVWIVVRGLGFLRKSSRTPTTPFE